MTTGLDLVAIKPSLLRPCYEQFNDWLAEHDRRRMTATFAFDVMNGDQGSNLQSHGPGGCRGGPGPDGRSTFHAAHGPWLSARPRRSDEAAGGRRRRPRPGSPISSRILSSRRSMFRNASRLSLFWRRVSSMAASRDIGRRRRPRFADPDPQTPIHGYRAGGVAGCRFPLPSRPPFGSVTVAWRYSIQRMVL